MNSVKDFRGKIEPPVERGVLKIERYVQRLNQGYSAHGGSYLWAPVITDKSFRRATVEAKLSNHAARPFNLSSHQREVR